MDQINLQAYGKINLTLDVVGRRSDGYHLLESVMQSISLADQLSLKRQAKGITLVTDHPAVPTDRRNICWRAVTAFQNYTGVTGGVRIELSKKIPVQAGLGGGSTDAAGVLYGLNQLYDTNLTLQELQNLGLQLGADVPFCLQGGTALVQGIGEQIIPLNPFPQVAIILIKPTQGVSTREVYQHLAPSAYGGSSTARLVEGLNKKLSLQQLGPKLANALETVTVDLVPAVRVWKERLLDAKALGALMSGSGTTVFGIFADSEDAQAFQGKWAEQGQVFLVHPVPRGVDQMNGGDLG